MNIRSLGHRQVLQRGSEKRGHRQWRMPHFRPNSSPFLAWWTQNTSGTFKWINNPQNTTAWGRVNPVHTGPLLISPKHFSSLFYSLGILVFGQLAFRVQFCFPSSTFGVNTRGWRNKTPQAPWGGLASDPNNSESQIQEETFDQARAAGFPSLW